MRRNSDGEVTGRVGGERRTSKARMALAGLVASLKEVSAGAVSIDLADPELARMAQVMARGQVPDEPPLEDLDLWAQLTIALKGKAATFTLAAGPGALGGPQAFAQAWADLAQDKAKAGGTFTAVIPKPNLAKLGLR